MTINVNEMDKIAELLKANKKGNMYEEYLKRYTGPGTGLVWDEDSDTLGIADDWYADANGDIVRR